MPIKFQLRKYLESPLVFDTILDNLTPSQDGYIRSLVDGTIWQQRRAKIDCNIVIPLNFFFDDFTTKDTVSPHASRTSILGIYYYIPCLPGYILAKLANILVAGYMLSEDRKEYENEDLFSNLVHTLIDLEVNGLTISYNGADVTVHFMLGFMTGDNLKLNRHEPIFIAECANVTANKEKKMLRNMNKHSGPLTVTKMIYYLMMFLTLVFIRTVYSIKSHHIMLF